MKLNLNTLKNSYKMKSIVFNILYVATWILIVAWLILDIQSKIFLCFAIVIPIIYFSWHIIEYHVTTDKYTWLWKLKKLIEHEVLVLGDIKKEKKKMNYKQFKESLIMLIGSLIAVSFLIITIIDVQFKWIQAISIVLTPIFTIFFLISLYEVFRYFLGMPVTVPDSFVPLFLRKINKKSFVGIMFIVLILLMACAFSIIKLNNL